MDNRNDSWATELSDRKSPFPDVIKLAQGAAQGAAGFVADAVGGAGNFIEGMLPRGAGETDGSEVSHKACEPTVREDYVAPDPMYDSREMRELSELTERYEKLTEPGILDRAGSAVMGFLPDGVKDLARGAAESLTEQELYTQMMKIVAEGFGTLERYAAAATVSDKDVLASVNKEAEEHLSSLDELCLLRSYVVARAAQGQNVQHLLLAAVEGAATGAVGFAGIPFNLVLSMFLYYRAVQSIALSYGYDVRNDPSELMIASQVLSFAFSPTGADLGGAAGVVGKIMGIAEVATVGQVVKKGWQAMAERGGACLLIAQMRALAHASARKALEKAGKAGLERSAFRNILEQVGKRLPQKAVQRGVPIIGGLIGALFDTGQMQRTLSIADTFYHKRFLVEKELRVSDLVDHIGLDSEMTDDVAEDVLETIREADDAGDSEE